MAARFADVEDVERGHLSGYVGQLAVVGLENAAEDVARELLQVVALAGDVETIGTGASGLADVLHKALGDGLQSRTDGLGIAADQLDHSRAPRLIARQRDTGCLDQHAQRREDGGDDQRLAAQLALQLADDEQLLLPHLGAEGLDALPVGRRTDGMRGGEVFVFDVHEVHMGAAEPVHVGPDSVEAFVLLEVDVEEDGDVVVRPTLIERLEHQLALVVVRGGLCPGA